MGEGAGRHIGEQTRIVSGKTGKTGRSERIKYI